MRESDTPVFTLIKCLALLRSPSVVCLELSAPTGTRSFRFSRQDLRWALRFFSSSLWVDLCGILLVKYKYFYLNIYMSGSQNIIFKKTKICQEVRCAFHNSTLLLSVARPSKSQHKKYEWLAYKLVDITQVDRQRVRDRQDRDKCLFWSNFSLPPPPHICLSAVVV